MLKTRSTIAFSAFCLFAGGFVLLQSCRKSDPLEEKDMNEWWSGGKQTVFISGSSAFSQPFNGLTEAKAQLHEFGDRVFAATFNSDPTQLYHGLGPIFNNVSCGSCHIADGRGKAPNTGESLSSLLLRISVNGQSQTGGPLGVPLFGGQLQQRAILGSLPEASVGVSYTENTYQFPDGESYALRQPVYTLSAPYTSMPGGVMVSPRMATPVFGLGLLEAIPEADIIARADEGDADGDGISGKANYSWDVMSNSYKLGRFGWKAVQPSIIQQSAGAFVEDMGVTSMIFPIESSQGQVQDNNLTNKKEVSDSTLYAVAYYIKSLAVPGRRNADDATVKKGKQVFMSVGCNKCHVSMQKTQADMAFPELSNQTIFPYTDLLVHDMGPDLADNRPDYRATGSEWRTSPLWGIGLTTTVNNHNNFLHDGRARNFIEAIMWHGGEASQVRDNFKNLSKADRDALIKFLGSL